MKQKPSSRPANWPSTSTSPSAVTADEQLGAVVEAARQRRGAAVDEALGQALVQRVRQPVLDGAGALLPVRGIVEPGRPVRDVGPGADMREPHQQRIDVALDLLEARDLVARPSRSAACRRRGAGGGRSARQGADAHRPASCGNPGSGRRPTAAARRRGRARGRRCCRRARAPRASCGRRPRACGSAPAMSARRSRLASSAAGDRKSSSALRQKNAVRFGKRCCSIASTVAGSRPPTSAVVPNVPSLMWRPARPAICASSATDRRRGIRPSNFTSSAKATWSMSMLRPMPIASVATR